MVVKNCLINYCMSNVIQVVYQTIFIFRFLIYIITIQRHTGKKNFSTLYYPWFYEILTFTLSIPIQKCVNLPSM